MAEINEDKQKQIDITKRELKTIAANIQKLTELPSSDSVEKNMRSLEKWYKEKEDKLKKLLD